ncbi:KUP/HAK/KT family potassium transporter [Emticicia sp. W12TSBA100-4]|uniref:KUP/HAK/KT family potassium transporter n=1 Tax=Emticicia sp. W12TSBA100-4 TaxID=3160965 RepID=UPI003306748E
MSQNHKNLDKVTAAGLLITLGIIFGDIGTSPLYVMQAIIGKEKIDEEIVFGSLSLIFWTLTLQTTLKYVILILRADNNGEGGIFALYALVRRHAKWLTIPAIIGGSTLLADGIITPPVSVSSAIEGLQLVYPDINTIPIIITIITILFLVQAFGTNLVGKAFGPVMFIWFSMLAILGLRQIINDPAIFKALNPYHAYRLLFFHQDGFWLLGSVFLCTTGAEALYSDLGHCGRGNIRISWIFVKICLLLNYFGQGVWAISMNGQHLDGRKPFYQLMPDWFLLIGIGIATMATIIASQALITGSYTLISEAIRLTFWPKVRLKYPSDHKGQLYIRSINWLLWAGCVGVVLYFKESANMEAAYGLAITLTMLMTTVLAAYYLYTHRFNKAWIVAFLVVYVLIEGAFLAANMLKFSHGGWVSVLIASVIALVMIIWYRSNIIKNRLTEFVKLEKYIDGLKELSKDESVQKYSTHLVYMSNAHRVSEIESKVMYSIFEKRPKRADIYWFIHVDITDEPYTMKYKVNIIEPDDVIKVTFKLGFRVEQKINLYFRKVIEEMVKRKEVDIRSRYESLSKQNVTGDFRFVVLERYLSNENKLPFWERLTMEAYFFIKGFTNSEDKWFGLDTSNVKVEKVPLILRPIDNISLEREE